MWKLDKSVVGKRFHSLTVLDEYELIPQAGNKKGTKTRWKVRCDCGNEFYVFRKALLSRKIDYCPECRPVAKRNTKLYHVYYGMKQRCYNRNNPKFEIYGGKGIKICNEWLCSYDVFRDWSYKNGYKDNMNLTIDRIDSDKDYCPDNCQWVTRSTNTARSNYGRQQVFSKLKYIYAISPNGDRIDIKNISKFSRDYGINRSTVEAAIHGRINNIQSGWEFHSPLSRHESVTTIESTN